MFSPVLVVPPAALPVSLARAKAHLRVSHSDEDAAISEMIAAATSYLDGPTGILGRCLVTQTWRQDYAGWGNLWLPFPDVHAATVTYRDSAGVQQTVDAGDVMLERRGGRYGVRFVSGWSAPALLAGGLAPVSITFTAGFGGPESVPASLCAAILLHVGTLYEHRESMVAGDRPAPTGVYEMQIAPWRVWP